MLSNLVFLGYVVDNNDIIGAKLCDIVKRESSLISINSFKNGIKNGIKILNVNYNNGNIEFNGGLNSYSHYNKSGKLLKLGSSIVTELDDGSWVLAKPDGKVKKVQGSLNNFSDIVRLPNEERQKARLEKERIAREQAEKERLARERERIAREKAEKERLEKERLAREQAKAIIPINSNLNLCNLEKYKDTNDIDILMDVLGHRKYGKILAEHLNGTRLKRGTQAEFICGNLKFVYEKAAFVAYRYSVITNEWCRLRNFTKFKIKNILVLTLNTRNGEPVHIALLTDVEYADGDEDNIIFQAIYMSNYCYAFPFRLRNIVYLRDTKNWYGSKEIFSGVREARIANYEGPASIEMLIAIKNNKEGRVVALSSKKEPATLHSGNVTEVVSLALHVFKLDKNLNFAKNSNILNTMASYNAINRNNTISIPRQEIYDIFAFIDKVRDTYRPCENDGIQSIKLSRLDSLGHELYLDSALNTKDKANVYTIDDKEMLIFHNNFKEFRVHNLYNSEFGECNAIRNKAYSGEPTEELNKLNIQNDIGFTSLNEAQLNNLMNSLERNVIYKNIPISKFGHIYDNGLVMKNIRYCLVTDTEQCSIVTDGKHNMSLLNSEHLLKRYGRDDLLDKYRGLEELSSVVYMCYRAVLKYDNTIPRCEEQLMLHGEMEDILDKLVIEELISPVDDVVIIYLDRYKVSMQLSYVVSKLKEIYDNHIKMTEGKYAKKIGIMKMAAGIDTVSDKIILNDSIGTKTITVPEGINGLLVETKQMLELDKLILDHNVTIEYKYFGTLKVKNLELKNGANNVIQKYSKSNNRLIYKSCKIHDLNISGRTLYDFMLTILYANDTFLPNRYETNPHVPMVGSREEKIAKYVYIGNDKVPADFALKNLLTNIHKTYDLSLSEKSLLSLSKYIDGLFTESRKYKNLMKISDSCVVGQYLTLLSYVLKSYNFNDFCCNSILRIGNSLVMNRI